MLLMHEALSYKSANQQILTPLEIARTHDVCVCVCVCCVYCVCVCVCVADTAADTEAS